MQHMLHDKRRHGWRTTRNKFGYSDVWISFIPVNLLVIRHASNVIFPVVVVALFRLLACQTVHGLHCGYDSLTQNQYTYVVNCQSAKLHNSVSNWTGVGNHSFLKKP